MGVFAFARTTGLEPATFCVTGRRSNQIELRPHVPMGGVEPPTLAL